MTVPEYGRHVQNMVQYALTIEDQVQRQLFAEMIINIMYQLTPGTKPSREANERLWNHLFRIADYKLDVTPPEDIVIVTKEKRAKPPQLKYPVSNSKYRHYGSYVQKLIEKAGTIEEGEKRNVYANAIGSYMKLASRTWGHDQHVIDEVIKNDLRVMSQKRLDLSDDTALDYLGNIQHIPKKKKGHKALMQSQHNGKKKNRKRNNKYKRSN